MSVLILNLIKLEVSTTFVNRETSSAVELISSRANISKKTKENNTIQVLANKINLVYVSHCNIFGENLLTIVMI